MRMKKTPIAVYSKKLIPCQTRYYYRKEADSVLTALQKFDISIFGSQIEVFSDNDSFAYHTHGLPQGVKLERWALALQRYNLKISYRKGSRYGNADALSRFP